MVQLTAELQVQSGCAEPQALGGLLRAQPVSCEEEKLPMENSQVLPGFKVMFKKYKNISTVVSEDRKRCETRGSKGRECYKSWAQQISP